MCNSRLVYYSCSVWCNYLPSDICHLPRATLRLMRKLPLTIKLRMWLDYLKYLIFLQQGETIRVLMGFLIFILSVYLLEHELVSKLKDPHGEQTLNLIIILIIIKFIWESYVTQSELRSYFHIQRSILRNNLTKPYVSPNPKEKENGFQAVEIPGNKADLIFVSEKVNEYIRQTPLPITLSTHKQQEMRKYIHKHREILLQYFNHYFFNSLHSNRQFTNERKLCLSKDINLNSKQAVCHVGGYYDSFVTNQVSGTTLLIKDKVHTTITTEHIFPSVQDGDGNHFLSDISSSQMNDHLGCSTIGFTKDNFIILWTQGTNNMFSKDLLAPTGSGSTNYSDLSHHNLQKTVIKTMERELSEETIYHSDLSKEASSNLNQANLNKTLILGFYRWVTRGGKPEFTGITKLAGNADEYKPRLEEMRSRAPLKLKISSIDDLPRVIGQIKSRPNLSTPLYMCLYQLEQVYKSHKEELKEFLFN